MADLERIGETINHSFRRYPPIFDHTVRNASTIEPYYHEALGLSTLRS